MSVTKIGILGGTFDPVHLGHLQLAESALNECGLDRVLFIPAALPPHKEGSAVTSFTHRAAMLLLASKMNKSFDCDLIEAQLPKPSYTIDTMLQLQKKYGDGVRLFFILGADAFLEIASWKDYRTLLNLLTVVISLREGASNNRLIQLLEDLEYELQGSNCYRKVSGQEVCILESIPAAVSSSSIRVMVRRRESIRHIVPPEVEQYIQKHLLYQQDSLYKGFSDN